MRTISTVNGFSRAVELNLAQLKARHPRIYEEFIYRCNDPTHPLDADELITLQRHRLIDERSPGEIDDDIKKIALSLIGKL